MRISTSSIFETSTNQMGSLQSQLARTQMQLSTNKRVLSPSDDPVASARALEVTQSQSMNSQYATNRSSARSSLEQVDGALTSAGDLMRSVQDLVSRAGNASLSPADRASLATELDGRIADLVSVANTTDGSGAYLFAGYKVGTQPFTQTSLGATYSGDQGQRELQVGASRKLAVADTGSAIFENNPTVNGTFHTSAAATNTGTATVAGSQVLDRSKLTGHDYSIKFTVGASGTTYDVIDNSQTPPGTLQSAQPYVAGNPIAFDGMSFTVNGGPADGDQLDINANPKQSIFTTLTDLANTLRAPVSGTNGDTALANSLAIASDNISKAMDNVLTVQASVGSRLKELDSLDDAGSQLDVQYASTLSGLQDLDMVKAISLFTQQQQTLQAAQMSFKTMSSLSLFNYIS